MENNRNFLITIALSVLIVVLWQVFYMNPRVAQQREAQRIEQERVESEKKKAAETGAPPAGTAQAPAPGVAPAIPDTAAATAANREQALTTSQRIKIDTPSLGGSINLKGARLDDLQLKHYRETVDPSSPTIELLNPEALPNGFLVEVGFSSDGTAGTLPGPETVWTTDSGAQLTPSTPVTLTWNNEKSLTFKRIISVDANYMFTISDTVSNAGNTPVSVNGYGLVKRFDKPLHASTYVLHEGLVGAFGEKLHEYTYANIEKEKGTNFEKSSQGWLGITDKYWAATVIPSGKQPFTPRYSFFGNDRPRYQADFLTEAISVAPGQSETVETMVFAGAKEVAKINAYAEDRNIFLFDKLIDWGWYPFLTKPMFWLIDNLYKLLGNFGLAILATTIVVKAFFFPLANKSYKSMANMKKVQPKMLEIREKYADDKMKQQQAMMELYKTEKINPLAGCWPVLVQVPVFFALYKVLYITIEMRHAPFYGWIHDLAAPDPTSLLNLFGLLPFTAPAMLHIGIWPLIMGVTMFLQMRMNPAPPDPTQAMVFNWMPVVFTFMMATFPAGLIIYWAWNNTLSIVQQGIIMKRQGAKIELWDNLAGLFKRKPTPAE